MKWKMEGNEVRVDAFVPLLLGDVLALFNGVHGRLDDRSDSPLMILGWMLIFLDLEAVFLKIKRSSNFGVDFLILQLLSTQGFSFIKNIKFLYFKLPW